MVGRLRCPLWKLLPTVIIFLITCSCCEDYMRFIKCLGQFLVHRKYLTKHSVIFTIKLSKYVTSLEAPSPFASTHPYHQHSPSLHMVCTACCTHHYSSIYHSAYPHTFLMLLFSQLECELDGGVMMPYSWALRA